jgi:hypothetical protein
MLLIVANFIGNITLPLGVIGHEESKDLCKAEVVLFN